MVQIKSQLCNGFHVIAVGKHGMFLQPCLHPAPRKGEKMKGEGEKNVYLCFEHVQISFLEKKKSWGRGKKTAVHGNHKEHNP